MKKTLSNVAVLCSLVFVLVLSGGVGGTANTSDDANAGISVCNDMWFPDCVED